MKKDKDKSKKGHESTIGKIIYGFLLFLPLLAIGVTCAYAIFNKNAYQSYDTPQNTSLQKISNHQSLVIGETYTISHIERPTTGQVQSPIFYFNGVDEYLKNCGLNNNLTYVGMSFQIGTTGNIFINGYTDYETTTRAAEEHAGNINWINNRLPVSFQLDSIYTPNGYTNISTIDIYRNFTTKGKLSDIFYFSIDKVEQSNLFNWTQNSLIYTGMSEFTNQLSITNTFIPMLLTYWLIISVVYFLYDIILVILTVLHRKIHNLQESI